MPHIEWNDLSVILHDLKNTRQVILSTAFKLRKIDDTLEKEQSRLEEIIENADNGQD